MLLISHFASGISLASSFSHSLLQALRQFLPSVIHMAMICKSQLCLGSGVCILFQKGTSAYGIGLMVWSPRICICAGICSGAMQGQLLQMLGMVRYLMTLFWFIQCSA